MQTSPVVKQYYRCLEAGSTYKDDEWARMQAACSSQGPSGAPGSNGPPHGPPRGTPDAYGSSQGAGGRGNAGAGRGNCFK